MHHQQCGGRAELERKIPIADRVQGILANPFEAEQLGRHGTVDGKAGAGQGRGAEGHLIDTPAAFGQTLLIAHQHLIPGHHVVTKGDWLRGLQVGESGHDRVGLAFRHIDNRRLEPGETCENDIGLVTQIKPHVGGDLIIARARGVQTFARFTDLRGECGLDIHVHVFERIGPFESTGADVVGNLIQSLDDGVTVFFVEHLDAGEHRGVGYRAANIVFPQPPVEADRGGKRLSQCIGGSGKTPTPELVAGSVTGRVFG